MRYIILVDGCTNHHCNECNHLNRLPISVGYLADFNNLDLSNSANQWVKHFLEKHNINKQFKIERHNLELYVEFENDENKEYNSFNTISMYPAIFLVKPEYEKMFRVNTFESFLGYDEDFDED